MLRTRLTPDELIQRAEQNGQLVKDCPQCEPAYEALRAGKDWPWAPSHKAMPTCRSGSRPHCTCDTCF